MADNAAPTNKHTSRVGWDGQAGGTGTGKG